VRLPQRVTGSNTLTARPTTRPLCHHLLRTDLPAACTLSPERTRRRSATTSAHLSRTAPEATFKPSRQMEPAVHVACWVSCSGLRNARAHIQSAQRRQTPAKRESVWARKPTTFHCRCPRCGRTDSRALSEEQRGRLGLPFFIRWRRFTDEQLSAG
jgi:hypothetical protein